MKKVILLFSILYCLETNAQQPLQVVGRSAVLNDGRTELISPGAHFDIQFSGKKCAIIFSLPDANAHSYVQYELDGQYVGRYRIDALDTLMINASQNGVHRACVFKTTEAHSGALYVNQIIGKKVKALAPQKIPVIEFIGNSITCGAAADPSEVPCGTGVYHDQHNAYMAYGPRVARAIGADFVLNSVSGIGIYRTWNKEYPSMPLIYGNLHFKDTDDVPWDVERFHPSVVSIALGTNDLSRGDGKSERAPFDSTVFVERYIKFVQIVKRAQPKARIVLLSSGMVIGENRELLQRCLAQVKNAIDLQYPAEPQVVIYFFKPMKARGCTGHPNVDDHAILADELIDVFRPLIH
ncbi:MAG: GDSL-type esterase/lipase family protein [Chitinophagaceae bacterium]